MNKKNVAGFTLIEIMIAVALLGGIAVGFNTIMQNMTKGNLKAQTDSEMLLISNEMVAILSDPINCKASLETKLVTGGYN